jgi:signal transduction histidine kinase
VRMSRLPDNQIKIVVSDQGAGFDPVRLRTKEGTGAGFGLFSLRERLESLGGGMEVESAPGKGSRFTLVAPLDRNP